MASSHVAARSPPPPAATRGAPIVGTADTGHERGCCERLPKHPSPTFAERSPAPSHVTTAEDRLPATSQGRYPSPGDADGPVHLGNVGFGTAVLIGRS